MRFEDLYYHCCNLNMDSNIMVIEEGKRIIKAKLKDIYDEIYDRHLECFSVENDNIILIKFNEE